MNQQVKTGLGIAIIVILAITIGIFTGIVINQKSAEIPKTSQPPMEDNNPGVGRPVACTMEAMLCPDGKTYVSRTGPKCEFAPCPSGDSENISNWQTYESQEYGYSIKFPKSLYYKGNKVQSLPGEFGAMDLIISDIQEMGIQDVLLNEKIHITITVSKKESTKSLLEYLKKSGISEDRLTDRIIFDGSESYRLGYSNPEMIGKTIYTAKNSVVYAISFIGYLELGENSDSENFRLMQKIVDTFKFTK